MKCWTGEVELPLPKDILDEIQDAMKEHKAYSVFLVVSEVT